MRRRKAPSSPSTRHRADRGDGADVDQPFVLALDELRLAGRVPRVDVALDVAVGGDLVPAHGIERALVEQPVGLQDQRAGPREEHGGEDDEQRPAWWVS